MILPVLWRHPRQERWTDLSMSAGHKLDLPLVPLDQCFTQLFQRQGALGDLAQSDNRVFVVIAVK